MKKPDDTSYNLKMRASTRKSEPRAEETVVYHWGRILGALVSLLLIVFLVIWFFSTTPGSSVNYSDSDTSDTPGEPDASESISGTIQREPLDQTNASESTTDQTTDAEEPAINGESNPPMMSNEIAAPSENIDETGSVDDATPASSEMSEDTVQSTPEPQLQEDAVPEATDSAPQMADTPPGSVIDDPADRPAPTDDPQPEAESADSGDDGQANLEIASDHLQRAQLTWEIRDREPTTALPASISLGSKEVIRVYFFNELQGLKGQTVYHDWYLNDERVARVDINTYLDQMRASSGKYINQEMLGEWRVEAVTESGENLGTGSFSVSK